MLYDWKKLFECKEKSGISSTILPYCLFGSHLFFLPFTISFLPNWLPLKGQTKEFALLVHKLLVIIASSFLAWFGKVVTKRQFLNLSSQSGTSAYGQFVIGQCEVQNSISVDCEVIPMFSFVVEWSLRLLTTGVKMLENKKCENEKKSIHNILISFYCVS